ncbi:hypothetical protein BCR32DRAFT_250012 [Anaeromyces robustus]|uniref:Uncharacterized protein n=1 Tax=Anaeromyces robustus TaxID=1754192 RepID=A0A1Y1WHG1_9FUNG|nr:hypothetical protein BCR32DRAFT_250012 [Anaeromyces robustus]|eukprot:ORX72564.1 hypothetical protein BCR32DRAFT_250012 [Anaeromyces robustus]
MELNLDSNYVTDFIQTEEIERRFKELYKSAEIIEFEDHMENINIFRKLTGIKLIDSNKGLNIMSIYDRKVENPNFSSKEHQYYNNYNFKEFIKNGVTGNNNIIY